MGRYSVDVLQQITECGTLDSISRTLGLREQTVRAIINTMVDQGLIEIVEQGKACSRCPFKCGNCLCSDVGMSYAITRKGFSLLEKEMYG
ncbi:MAG TPA: hypothetical protein PK718_08895 [Candidatus Methanofastidiosa archaeon]|nr:hypothetical protein [Candidatus Methanofastidiosa archaeon]HPR42640.1 hypothetical protein [Candidatus Methanofastidiosa archaeon]